MDDPILEAEDIQENVVYDYGQEKPKRDHHKAKGNDDSEWYEERLLPGLILVGLGTFFLLQAFGLIGDFAWWSLFILIPGLMMLMTAWVNYMRTGTVYKGVREQAFGGVMLVLVGSIFLFDLDWGKVWPLFLIVPGIGLLLGWIGDGDDQ